MGRETKLPNLKGYYGIDNPSEVLTLLINGIITGLSTAVLLYTYGMVVNRVHESLPWIPLQFISFGLGFAVAFIALLSFAYWFTLISLLHTSLLLRFRMARKMVSKVPDWSKIVTVLDVGCGKGLLLNTVAMRLQKEGCGGRVVGVDLWLENGKMGRNDRNSSGMGATLKAALAEGVGELVTCKSGDSRDLPFSDNYFDLVMSALYLHNIGQDLESSENQKLSAKERKRALQEIIRVVKPGGQILIWDILHTQEYYDCFKEVGLQDVELSDSVAAFMLQSRILSARKPSFKKLN